MTPSQVQNFSNIKKDFDILIFGIPYRRRKYGTLVWSLRLFTLPYFSEMRCYQDNTQSSSIKFSDPLKQLKINLLKKILTNLNEIKKYKRKVFICCPSPLPFGSLRHLIRLIVNRKLFVYRNPVFFKRYKLGIDRVPVWW